MTEKKKKVQEKEGIDIGAAPLVASIGGLFKGLEGLISLVGKVREAGGEIRDEGDIKGLGKGAKGVYGFSIRTLAGGPVIERFGNIKETSEGPRVEETREPMVDIFEEKDRIVIIAEVPGVEEKDVRIDAKEDMVSINAKGRDRKYGKDVKLPSPVDPATLESTYKNGIVEIKLKRPCRDRDRKGNA